MFSPPSSSTSNRRSSISSVTSSGRRRDQSLLDVAESLGKRTPERSQTSVDGVSTRSRQLDFGNDEHHEQDHQDQIQDDHDHGQQQGEQDESSQIQDERDQVRDEQDGAAAAANAEVEGADTNAVEQKPRNLDKKVRRDNHDEGQAVALSGRTRGRRGTVFWSAEEEDFLRRGVAKHGVGKWKKILMDGQYVFKEHRTNVDLKDKWKNLQRSSRKRPRTPGSESLREDLVETEEQPAVQHRSDSPAPAQKSRHQAAVMSDRASAHVDEKNATVESVTDEVDEEYHVEDGDVGSDEVSSHDEPSGLVKLKFATDMSFPELAVVEVDLTTCQNVSALKDHLRSTLLSDVPPPVDIRVIGLDSRLLFEDEEPLSWCVRCNGPDFFLILEESPEEFV